MSPRRLLPESTIERLRTGAPARRCDRTNDRGAVARARQLEARAGSGWILDLRFSVTFHLHIPAPHRIVRFRDWRADAVYHDNVGSLECPRWTRVAELWLPTSDASAALLGHHAAIEHDFSLLQLIL